MRTFVGFFNISMSYRLDADIRHGYGELRQVSPHPTSSNKLTDMIMNFGIANKHLAIKEKLKEETLICQFVSNCRTESERNAFVLKISISYF